MCFQNMFNVSAIQRLRLEHNLTLRGDDETEVSSLLQARGMDTVRLWRETMHAKRSMIREASLLSHVVYITVTDTRPEACRSGPPLAAAAANCNNHFVRVSSLIHYHHDRVPFLYVLRHSTVTEALTQ